MTREWRVALVQAEPVTAADPVADLHADLDTVLAAHPGTRMVVYPELHLFGAADDADDHGAFLEEAAEPLDGPRVRALAELARRAGVWLVPGTLPERDQDGNVYNTAVVLDPDGRLVASYRKVFPWRPHETCAPGDRFVVFDVPDVGRMGLSICYDSWFPESTRQLAWLGAEVVLNLVKTTTHDRAQELVLAQAHAIVNQVWFLSVNSAGPRGKGHSIHVDPEGAVVAHLAHAEPAVTGLVVDLDRVRGVREHGTAGLNRVWEQLRDGDPPIELPAYGGQMRPGRWNPAR
ncbi:MAG: carbon-nitrogen hydrolase family protein [Nocardioidaceae bacterium]